MSFISGCPNCGQSNRHDSQVFGQELTCVVCRQAFTVVPPVPRPAIPAAEQTVIDTLFSLLPPLVPVGIGGALIAAAIVSGKGGWSGAVDLAVVGTLLLVFAQLNRIRELLHR